MDKARTIQTILYGEPKDMGGMPIRQPFPGPDAERIDPFLLLHHADIKLSQHIETRHAGVGPHPHRGFSPVSFIFRGGVHHRDSRGNDQVIYAGGTQWMNAGMGVIHSERPPADIHEMGSRQELIQLWVNTPAKHKMDIPAYFPLTAEQTPVWVSADGRVHIHVIAGELNGIKGPIKPLSPLNTFTGEMQQGGRCFIPVPENHQAFIYLLSGTVLSDGKKLDAFHAAVYRQDGAGLELEALEDTRLFIGTGEPLNEEVAAHGPFVMNNETQILEAFRDYQMGKMGVLIED
ncbi:MAG TPA: pirin family protein [Sediminibacterium sp.]|nr:pirin family protein [Sediminibacterium sp.]